MFNKISNEDLFRRIQNGEDFLIRKYEYGNGHSYELVLGENNERYLVDEETGKTIIEMDLE